MDDYIDRFDANISNMIQTIGTKGHSDLKDGLAKVINDLVKEKGKTCVSVIVPTHRIGQDRQGDRLEVTRALMEANEALVDKPGNFSVDLHSLFQQIDFNRSKEGIGIFASPDIKRLLSFAFPVAKKIVVKECFHLDDLIYAENYEVVYYLLDISKKEIHLFRGIMDQLEEVKDENFPKKIVDRYEYSKPSHSNSGSGYAQVKDVERDKSALQEIRLKKIFQAADKLLSRYITPKNAPLLLGGPTKDVSIYRSATKHGDNIITSISDPYKGTSIHDPGVPAWQQIRSFIDAQKLKLVNEFEEKLGKGLGICGIENIWPAAQEGKGLVLMVEKGYGEMEESPEKPARYADLVDEIINTVLEKNGQVKIVEKGILEDYGRIALITRY